MKKVFRLFLIFICSFSLISIFTAGESTQAASKDKKLPTVTLTPAHTSPTNKNLKITIKATDASGIKTVKWAVGKKSKLYFQTKGTTLKLNKNHTTSVSVNRSSLYSFYIEDKAGNSRISTISIENIDKTIPSLNLSYKLMNQVATIKVNSRDASGIESITYVKGNIKNPDHEKWDVYGKKLENTANLNVTSSGRYSFLAIDKAGNKRVSQIDVSIEFKGMWISYLEFKKTGYTEEEFKAHIDEMFDNTANLGMNAVVVQIRPSGDALYHSKYYPWSEYVSGEQGKNPGYDPLSYMVKAAHARGLEFHAWINPYRVTLSTTNYNTLSIDNPARIWKEDKDKSNDRNVLSFGGKLYYNPASTEVQKMIVNDIGDIVNKYNVDGIHFDDYFYPALGTSYKTNFDAAEYTQYKNATIKAKKEPLSIENWRRENVNTLIRNIYTKIKSIDSNVQFGISPHGNISNLIHNTKYYVDVDTWLSSDKYVDYIAPQIYWTFSHKTAPFDKVLERWLSVRTNPSVNVYVGIANYRANQTIADDPGWKESNDQLMQQIEYARHTGKVDGFIFFRYQQFFTKTAAKEIENLLSVLHE